MLHSWGNRIEVCIGELEQWREWTVSTLDLQAVHSSADNWLSSNFPGVHQCAPLELRIKNNGDEKPNCYHDRHWMSPFQAG